VRKPPFVRLPRSNKTCIVFSRASIALTMLVLPTAAVADAVQWAEAEGGNGHWYQGINAGPISWIDSRVGAIAIGGDLASLETGDEVVWVFNTVASDSALWSHNANENDGPHIGGFQNTGAPDYNEPDGGWYWLTGTPLQATYWGPGQPNNSGSQNHLHFWSTGSSIDITFDDVDDDDSSGGSAYIIEWSADCNGDGIVDYGQILDGTFDDVDGNGVPDVCESLNVTEALQWEVADGGNGHWYSRINFPNGVNPEYHFVVAESLGGHTATISSQEENDICFSVDAGNSSFIGVRKQEGNNVPEWITGEPWVYSNWHSGEGQNYWERYADYWAQDGSPSSTWQDRSDHRVSSIIEWSDDCDGDGIVDYGQILDGTFEDVDGNGVPDCCDAGEPCSATATNHVLELLQWPDAAVIPHHSSITPLDAMTIEFWVQADGPWGRAITKRPGSGGCYTVEGNHDDVGCDAHADIFGGCLSGGWDEIPCSWTHLAVTVDGASGTTRNYENGVLVYEDVLGSECTIGQGSWDLRFGNTNGYSSTQFVGRLDNIRIWNAPLSEDDIRHWMVTDITPEIAATLPDLGGSWNFEDGVADATGINNGWLEGGAVLVEDQSIFFDCNGNMIPDSQDIADGTSLDCNTNGIPDECDIDDGFDDDCNGDGVPDSCQTYNDESTWTNAAGGHLLDPDNWSDCQSPDATSDLFFILPDAYPVTCPNHEVGSASVRDGTVTFALEGTLELGDAGDNQGLLVESEGDEPMATLLLTSNTSGELLCTEVTIAGSASSFGALTLQGGDTLMTLSSAPAIINVGAGGTGYLSILDEATVTTGDIQLGDFGPGMGTLEIGENATIVVNDTLAIMPGSEATLVPSGKITGGGDVRVKAGGRLSGNGEIQADVKNFGRVEATPGEPMRILGNYEQPAPATLNFSGTFAASIQDEQTWGAIHSTKHVELGGLLDLTVDPAYTPAQDDEWIVLTAGTGISDVFDAFDVALITGLPDDMYADIVYSNAIRGNGGDTVTVVFGSLDAPLAFDSPAPVTLNATPTAMLLQDLDGDGADELIITIAGDPGVVLVYLNEGGLFASVPLELSVGPSPVALVAGDFTGDGEIEIASADAVDGTITFFIRDPLGDYPPLGGYESFTYPTDGGGMPVSLAAGNFLDDAASDELAVACAGTDTIEFWKQGTRLRTLDFISSVVVDLDDTPGGIDPGQVNEDKDFVPLAVTLPDEGDIVVLTYDDGGGVDDPGYYPETYPAGANPSQVRVASLDGLATTPNDLVVLNQTDGTISILLDQGNSYLPAANLPVGQNPDSIDLADLDADGDQDIVLVAIDSSTGESTVLILRNDFVPTGQLVFAPAAHLELPPGTIPVLVGDGAVDFDVYPDLVTINDGGAGFRSGAEASFSIARNDLCNFPNCAGDFNVDGLVGVDDLLAFLDGFGTSDGDVDCDGISDINDLLVLIGNWGPCN
jgi:hypothetical protein